MLSQRMQALTAACLPLVLSGAMMFAQKSRARSGAPTDSPASAAAQGESSQSESGQMESNSGERVFMANCSRCHTPPMSLSPRITGTVMMHMRVRARLSKEDQHLLLKYLAP